METLAKIFGNEVKVKVIKLFIFNQDKIFTIKDIIQRVQSDSAKVRREVSLMEKMGLIKKRSIKKGHGYIINPQFSYLTPLQNFLINTEPLQPKEIIKKITSIGSIKLIVTSGIFIQDPESRADILIVGDGIKKTKLENTIKNMESEIGKEIRYAYFSTEEFKYRVNMYDKLTRDILDYPHNKVFNKLGIV